MIAHHSFCYLQILRVAPIAASVVKMSEANAGVSFFSAKFPASVPICNLFFIFIVSANRFLNHTFLIGMLAMFPQ
jgi:hypothetical protein